MNFFVMNNKGFTLLKLMIITSILSVASVITIPHLVAYQNRAHSSMVFSDAKNFGKAGVNSAISMEGLVR